MTASPGTQDETTRLHRLVYVSRNRVEDDGLDAAVERILAAARRNNVAADVTGALLFNTGTFAQVLEGPRDAVRGVFERIQVDERHDDVRILEWAAATTRTFPTWSMGYVGAASEASSRFAHLVDRAGSDLARLDGDAVLGLLRDHLGVAAAPHQLSDAA